MVYDANSRLTGQLYPTGRRNTYTYDAAANRTVMADLTGSTTTTFDRLYRPLAVANPAGKTVSYSYDPANRRQTMTSPEGGLFTYTLDPAGNLVQLVNRRARTPRPPTIR
jgi:YD repeat-containing protein